MGKGGSWGSGGGVGVCGKGEGGGDGAGVCGEGEAVEAAVWVCGKGEGRGDGAGVCGTGVRGVCNRRRWPEKLGLRDTCFLVPWSQVEVYINFWGSGSQKAQGRGA